MNFINNYNNKEKWNQFVVSQQTGSFLQSWEWMEFQKDLGNKVFNIAIEEDNDLIAVCLVIQDKMSLSQTAFSCPYGPVLADSLSLEQKKQALSLIKKEIDKLRTKELLVLFEPKTNDKNVEKFLFELDFKQSVKEIQPKHTLILDLGLSEEDLLKQMHSKTRYNIRLADKKGVEVNESSDKKELQEFFNLLIQTGKRQDFTFNSINYFEKLLNNNQTKIYLAKFQNKVIAGLFMIYFGNTCTYLYGASADEFKNVMAPHLLQWTAIKNAKQKGFKYYDFWGVAPKENLTKREQGWQGITRFKQGFCKECERTEYLGTYEFVYKKFMVFIYRIIQKIKIVSS